MSRIVEYPEGFKLFRPSDEDYAEFIPAIKEKSEANRRFLEAHHEIGQPERAITGSFIYAHPPDYLHSMLDCDKTQWKTALARLQDNGVDTVVFQAAAWKELLECYYPSKLFRKYRQWDVLTPAIDAANELGLDFFLGEFGTVVNFGENSEAGDIEFQREVGEHLECIEELTKLYGKAFQGFYATSESLFDGTRNPTRENAIADFYQLLFGKMRECRPNLPILISPASYDCGEKLSKAADYWCTLFGKAAPDILAPQDSIGCVCVSLERQHLLYEQWYNATRRLGCHFWSNIELFEPFLCEDNETAFRAADPKRIAAQIKAANHAEKLICWEMLEFNGGHN